MKMEFSMPDDFVRKLNRLTEKEEQITGSVLKAGADVVYKDVGFGIVWAIGQDKKYPARSTGQLRASLGISPVKRDRNHNFNVKVGFREARNDKQINAKIANVLEHGRPGEKRQSINQSNVKQEAQWIFSKAKKRAAKAATEAMEAEFNRQIEDL